MYKLVLFNKPYGVLCQFTGGHDNNLQRFIPIKNVYPAGRLDKNSEGLVLLTNDGLVQARISNPKQKMTKVYWVQVEGILDSYAIRQLQQGVELNDGLAQAIYARPKNDPLLPARSPPIRYRARIPTSWLEIHLTEGRNRQVRRMTAAVGHPTLRLYRYSVGEWSTESLSTGDYRVIDC